MGSGVSTEGALTVEALAKPGVDAFEVAGTVEGQRLVMKTLLFFTTSILTTFFQ